MIYTQKRSVIRSLIFGAVVLLGLFTIANLSSRASASGSFITTWKTDNEGTSQPNQITIPVNKFTAYDYFVDWGDGTTDSGVNGEITHTYPSPGTYTVKISGDFPRMQFSNGGDRKKILSVEQWGDVVWKSGEAAFWGASNLVINATDAPNLSQATNLSYMFRDAKSITGGLQNWDVSKIEVFAYMFAGATKFNDNLSSWNMSRAFNTEHMFSGAILFNQNLSSWDMSRVGIAKGMFYGAASFNQSLNDWNVSSVFNVEDIFRNATSYNKSFGNWNIGGIEYIKGLLTGVSLSTPEYDSMLQAWRDRQTAKNLTIDAGNSTYCVGSSARDYLVQTLGWTISDGGADNVFCGAVTVGFESLPIIDENKASGTNVGVLRVSSSIPGEFSVQACEPVTSDSRFFSINTANGIVTTNTAFDYENPLDENRDNAYELCVRISNTNGQSTQRFVLVTISDVEDTTSGGGSGNGQGNGSGQGGQNGEGQVLGGATTNGADSGNGGKVLAATGVAIGLLGVYAGLSLMGITSLGFLRRSPKTAKHKPTAGK